MSKHTPGPWKWDEWLLTNGSEPVMGLKTEDSRERMDANRHLIAAAPSLLSALEAVEWQRDEGRGYLYCPECLLHYGQGHMDDCALHAALLLARGESTTTETKETK